MYGGVHSWYAAPEYFGPDYLKRLILVDWVRLFFSSDLSDGTTEILS
jgi:hypothetical protein